MERPVDPARLERVPFEAPASAPWYADRVWTALGSLTPRQAEIVERHFLRGQTEREIAADLGIAQQVVHRHLHGAVRDGRRVGGAIRKLHAALLPLARMARWVP